MNTDKIYFFYMFNEDENYFTFSTSVLRELYAAAVTQGYPKKLVLIKKSMLTEPKNIKALMEFFLSVAYPSQLNDLLMKTKIHALTLHRRPDGSSLVIKVQFSKNISANDIAMKINAFIGIHLLKSKNKEIASATYLRDNNPAMPQSVANVGVMNNNNSNLNVNGSNLRQNHYYNDENDTAGVASSAKSMQSMVNVKTTATKSHPYRNLQEEVHKFATHMDKSITQTPQIQQAHRDFTPAPMQIQQTQSHDWSQAVVQPQEIDSSYLQYRRHLPALSSLSLKKIHSEDQGTIRSKDKENEEKMSTIPRSAAMLTTAGHFLSPHTHSTQHQHQHQQHQDNASKASFTGSNMTMMISTHSKHLTTRASSPALFNTSSFAMVQKPINFTDIFKNFLAKETNGKFQINQFQHNQKSEKLIIHDVEGPLLENQIGKMKYFLSRLTDEIKKKCFYNEEYMRVQIRKSNDMSITTYTYDTSAIYSYYTSGTGLYPSRGGRGYYVLSTKAMTALYFMINEPNNSNIRHNQFTEEKASKFFESALMNNNAPNPSMPPSYK